LADEHVSFRSVSDADEAEAGLGEACVGAVIDVDAQGVDGWKVLEALRRRAPLCPLAVLSSSPDAARRARELGATLCVGKPINVDQLRSSLIEAARAVASVSDESTPVPGRKNTVTTQAAAEDNEDDEFISRNPVMQKRLQVAWRAAPTPATVLILGENGTGKTVLAQAIHRRSARRNKPFVTVNCPCLQQQLLESELFGHVKGSFTGAIADTLGKVAAAEGGTLFLDEIGDLPLSIQPKLLRLLQDRKYERVGETKSRSADIRVIAATNRDLAEEVKAGRFRADLYYRLNVIAIDVLPLRERLEDVAPLAETFLHTMGESLQRRFRGFSPSAHEALRSYRWPGNMRELRNAVERAAILSDRDVLDIADFSQLTSGSDDEVGPRLGEFVSVAAVVEEHIRQVIARAASLEHAARILGIDRSTLYRKRKRWQETLEDFSSELAPSSAAAS
jgi:NtrC-family two-component system response regulator AlgB